MFYPSKGLCEVEHNGVHLTVFPFYCGLRKGFWTFGFSGCNPPFSNLENVLSPKRTAIAELKVVQLFLLKFYPPKGLCVAESNGVHMTVFPFYCVWETVFGPFVSWAVIRLFQILKMFYLPKGSLPADSSRGSIVFTYVLFWVRKRILDFPFQRR